MKHTILFTLLVIAGLNASAQQANNSVWKRAKGIATAIDKDKSLAPVKFKEHKGTKKEYSYVRQNKAVVKLTCHWKVSEKDYTTITNQVFYLQDHALMYATETIVGIINKKDSSFWAGSYVFANGKLKDLVTLGHGKSEDDGWDAEQEVLSNYKQVLEVVKQYINKNKPVVDNPVQAYKTYYPDGKLRSIKHEGFFNGCSMPVGTDTLFYHSGEIATTTAYDNRKSLKDEGCHEGWTIETTKKYLENGRLKAVSQTKYGYEGVPCNCGVWLWYDATGKIVRKVKYANCYDQKPCKE